MKFSAAMILGLFAFTGFAYSMPGAKRAATTTPSARADRARYANVASLQSLPDWAGIWTFRLSHARHGPVRTRVPLDSRLRRRN